MGKYQGERKKQPSIQRRPMVNEIELETRFGRDITNLCRSNVTPGSILSDFSRKNSLQKTLKTSMRLRKQANNMKIKRSKQRTESEDSETGKIDPKELGMDINNSKHCELASGFHKDILNHLQQQEPTIRPWLASLRGLHTYRDQFKLQQQRIEQVEWIIKTHNDFDLKPETCMLSLNLFDRSVSLLATLDWQLLACACIRLASKYEEVLVNELSDFQWLCKQKYSRQQIIDVEYEVLLTLGFAIHQTCHFTVIERVRLLLGLDSLFQDVSEYVIKLCHTSSDLAIEDQYSLAVAVGTIVAKSIYGRCSLTKVTKSCNVSLSRIIDLQSNIAIVIDHSVKRCLNPARRHLCKTMSAAEVSAIDPNCLINNINNTGMIILPWYARLVVDTTLILGPLYLLTKYPRGFTTFLTEKRRIKRRKDFEDVKLRDTPKFSPEETLRIMEQLNIKERK